MERASFGCRSWRPLVLQIDGIWSEHHWATGSFVAAGGEEGHSFLAAGGGDVLLLEHGDYRGVVSADGGAPVTCFLALTKARNYFIEVLNVLRRRDVMCFLASTSARAVICKYSDSGVLVTCFLALTKARCSLREHGVALPSRGSALG